MTIFIGKAIAAAVAATSVVPAPTPQDAPLVTPPPVAGQDAPPTEGTASSQQNKNFFNPQISLVTDFRWNASDSDKASRKRAFMKEAELGMAADVDPFIRAEAYIAFADEDGEPVAEVEEAFGRYNNLSPGLSAKFGRIAAAIGRVQRNHVDQLNWLDYPLMVEDYLGEEGLRAGGGSLSYLLPGNRFNELTLEALDSHDKGIFAGGNAGAPVVVGAYRTFVDFGEDASAQLGVSYANGLSPVSGQRSDLIAAEFTYKWVPGSVGRSMNFEAEGYWGKQGGDDKRRFGGFAGVTYEVRPRMFAYARYDYSEIPGGTDLHKGWSLGATFKVTEFHHWRAEFQHIDSNFEAARNRLNFQFQWIIGAHPAHKY